MVSYAAQEEMLAELEKERHDLQKVKDEVEENLNTIMPFRNET